MSKRCPDCGFLNEDSRIYCSSCGELLDPELRLIQNLEKQTAASAKQQSAKTTPAPQQAPAKRRDDDDDYVPSKRAPEKKSSPLPWIILGVIAIAAIVLILNYAV